MQLILIKVRLEDYEKLSSNPSCQETIHFTIDFYKKVGFVQPLIGYYAEDNGDLVGTAGFKVLPIDGTVEIAYGTFEKYRRTNIWHSNL